MISAFYRIRCRHRQAFFTKFFRSFRFGSIEAWLASHTPSAFVVAFSFVNAYS